MADEISSALEGFALIGHEETKWGTLSAKMKELPADTDRWRTTHDLTKIYGKAGVGDRWAPNMVTIGRQLGALTMPGAFLADISTLLWWATVGHNTVTVQQSPTEWTTITIYVEGVFVTPVGGEIAHIYECTTGGTSGVAEPVWPTTSGVTVADGTVTWTCRTAVWKHVLTYLDAAGVPAVPPSVSMQIYEGDKAAASKMKQFLGGVVSTATLEWDASANDGVLDNSFELVAQAPTIVNVGAYTDPLFKPIPSWSVAVQMCEAGGSPTTFGDVVRGSYVWENNAEMVKTAIALNKPSDRAYGEALVSGRLVLLFRNMTEYNRWELGTQTHWVITATDPVKIPGTNPVLYRYLKLTMPVVDYQTLEVQKLGAFKVVAINFRAMRDTTLKAAASMEIQSAVKNWAA